MILTLFKLLSLLSFSAAGCGPRALARNRRLSS